MTFVIRKGASSGSWCTVLLPLCLVPALKKQDLDACSLHFAICSTCCVYSLLTKHETPSLRSYPNIILLTLFSILLSLFHTRISMGSVFLDVLLIFIVSFAILWYYDYLVQNLLTFFPGSFTLGEAQILSQGVILFLHFSLTIFFKNINRLGSINIQIDSESSKCLQIMLLGTLLLLQTLCLIPFLRKGIEFFISCFIVLFIMMCTWQVALKQNVFIWLFTFCIHSNKRIFLILFWIVCTLASVLIVVITNRSTTQSSTITRKYFHLIMNAIYIPGILYDIELLKFASGVALTIFILLEVCRILKIKIIGPLIDEAFQVFLDEKDSGVLVLTHIYLLIGCSSPLWLSEYISITKGFNMGLFSGIISVGFGDTAAAIGGTLFGTHKWKGSTKTYEGSFCAFTIQLLVSLLFLLAGHLLSTRNALIVLIAIFLTSLLEAKTTQVDNLVLPLFLFAFFSWIC